MKEVLEFIKEYKEIYKIERYVSIIVSIITLLILISFFGYQIFENRGNIDASTKIVTSFVGLGATGIISVSIGYIYKFMDKAMEAAEKFVTNKNNNDNGN